MTPNIALQSQLWNFATLTLLLAADCLAKTDTGPSDLLGSLLDPSSLPLPKDTSLENHFVQLAKEFPNKLGGFLAFVQSLTTAAVAVDKAAKIKQQLNFTFGVITEINGKIKTELSLIEKLPRDDCFSGLARETVSQADQSNSLANQVQRALKCNLADKCFRRVNDIASETQKHCETTAIGTTKFFGEAVTCLSQMPEADERLQKLTPQLVERLSISLAYHSLVVEFINAPLCAIYSAKFSLPMDPAKLRQTIVAQLIHGGTTPKPAPPPTTTPPKSLAEPKCTTGNINFVETAPIAASDWKKCAGAINVTSATIFQNSRLILMSNANNIQFSDKGKLNTLLNRYQLQSSAMQISRELSPAFASFTERLRDALPYLTRVRESAIKVHGLLSELTPSTYMGELEVEMDSTIRNLQKSGEFLGNVTGNLQRPVTIVEELYEDLASTQSVSPEKMAALRKEHQDSMKSVANDQIQFSEAFNQIQEHLKFIDTDLDYLINSTSGAWLRMAVRLRNNLARQIESCVPWPAISQSAANLPPANIHDSLAGKLGGALFDVVIHGYDLLTANAKSNPPSPSPTVPRSSRTTKNRVYEPEITAQQESNATATSNTTDTPQMESTVVTTRKLLPKTDFIRTVEKFTSLSKKVAGRLRDASIIQSINGAIAAVESELSHVEVDPTSADSMSRVSSIACRAKHFALVGTSMWNKPPLSEGLPLRRQGSKPDFVFEKNRVWLEVLQADLTAVENLAKRYSSDATILVKPAEDAAKIDPKTPGVENTLNALAEIASALDNIDLQSARFAFASKTLSTVLAFEIRQDFQWIQKLPKAFKGMSKMDQGAALKEVAVVLQQKLSRVVDFANVIGGTVTDLTSLFQWHAAGLTEKIDSWTAGSPGGSTPATHLNTAIKEVKEMVKTQQTHFDEKSKDARAMFEVVTGTFGRPSQAELEFVANALR